VIDAPPRVRLRPLGHPPLATAALALVLALSAAPARAAPDEAGEGGLVSELRLSLLNHDVGFPNAHSAHFDPFGHRFEGGVDLGAEVIFRGPALLRPAFAPRPRLGFTINTAGHTDALYADLVWDHAFAAGPFVEGFLGGAVHDGHLRDANPHDSNLGSRLLFHLGLEAGWRFYRGLGVSLMWAHMSNSALAAHNQGLDCIGIRLGWRFDA
jgi:lipid A 3-O-deacylase